MEAKVAKMFSSGGARLKRLLLPMATDQQLRSLAEDAGLKWDFSSGYGPRWLRGNWQYPEKVRLVILMAEPSTPDSDEAYSTDNEKWFAQAVHGPDRAKPFGTTHQDRAFKRKLEWFLGECGFDLKNHISTYSQIVMSNTFWLTLPEKQKFKHASRELEHYFLITYLRPMLLCFDNATIVGAGGKAHKRLDQIGVRYERMGALSPPGCFQRPTVARHKEIATEIRNSLQVTMG